MAGFAGVQFDVFSPALMLPELSASGLRDFRHSLAAQDQQLAGLRTDAGPKGLGAPADVDRVIARLDKAMEATAALNPAGGTRLLCVDIGPLPDPPAGPQPPAPKVDPSTAGLILLPTAADLTLAARPAPIPPPAPVKPESYGQVDGALTELGRRADRYGVTVAFHSDLASFAAIERALNAASCPWFGLDFDPAAALRDVWDIDDIFSRLGPLIRHVRAKDALAGTDRRTKPAPIGQGAVNWPELLANLDQAAYRGWLTIDPLDLPDRPTAASTAVQFLQKISR
jgi:sugar phosphate isomerase/epimerase